MPINNLLGELPWHAGCHYSMDKINSLLTISKNPLTDKVGGEIPGTVNTMVALVRNLTALVTAMVPRGTGVLER